MVERDFTVGEVPGVLWSAASGADRAPLVLMGQGGGNHKKHPAMAGRAQRLVTGCGFHVAVIDAPGHGDRPRMAHDEQEIAALFEARAAGEPEGPIVVRYNAYLASSPCPSGGRPRTPHRSYRRSAPMGRWATSASPWAPRSGCRWWRSSPRVILGSETDRIDHDSRQPPRRVWLGGSGYAGLASAKAQRASCSATARVKPSAGSMSTIKVGTPRKRAHS